MYSKAESIKLKKEFWLSFGAYMKPVPNAEGAIINWVNYKTGVKHLFFRMDADNKTARVAIEVKSATTDLRNELYQKLVLLKNIFHDIAGDNWKWVETVFDDDGSVISRIYVEENGISVFNQQHWPAIIHFLKENILRLDAFWFMVKEQFENNH